jgi:hypothetical protein
MVRHHSQDKGTGCNQILRRILMRLIWLLTLPFIIVGEPILHHTTL